MNKTEAAYAKLLESRKQAGEIESYQYEALTFRLAAKTSYTPDFFVVRSDGEVEFHEVKGGFIYPTGWLKFKIAAGMYPMFHWELAQKRTIKQGGGWRHESF